VALASVQPYTTPGEQQRYAVRWREGGKQRWRSFRLRKDAVLFARDKERQLELGPLYEAEPEKLGVYLESWLERHGQRVRPSTLKRRREALRALGVLGEKEVAVESPCSRPRRRGSGDTRRPFSSSSSGDYLQRLTVAQVEDAIAALARRAPRQAQIALATLKAALRDADKRGQRFDPNLLTIAPPKYDEREPRFLTWVEVEKLASFLPEQVKRLVLIAALTGLRQGELFDLRESDLSLQASRLRVRRSKTKAGERSVELPPLAVELLREQLLARPHTEALVFPAPQGGRWNSTNFMHRVFRPAVRRAGLDGLTCHDLRHTYVSLMGAAGVDVAVIAAQLGHADGGALLMRRYRHLFPQEAASAVGKLEALVRPVSVEEVETA
jgi:integrase